MVPPGRRRIMHAHVPGFELLVRADEDVGRAIYFNRNFELAEMHYLRRVIAADAVCADVGANIGFFTMLMAAAAPAGVVHAFEPLPLNVALIQASAAINRFDNLRIHASAVGAETGEVTFAEASDSAYSSILDTGRKPVERRLTVPLTTLDTVFAATALDVLKVDVEGAEALVLAGAARLLADPARRPTVLMIELDQQNLTAFGAEVPALVATLTGYGYLPHVLDTRGVLISYAPATQDQYNLVFTAPRQ